MAEQDYRKKRENLLKREQQFRSQGKTELANKMTRIDISRMNTPDGWLPVEARNIARNVKITDEQRQIQKLPTASIDETRGAITQRFAGESTSPGNIAQPKLLSDVSQEKLLEGLQDTKGDWYIKDPQQKEAFRTHAENYILTHTQQADPRKGLGKVFMYDPTKGDFDEKLIRNYQKFITGEKEHIMFNSKQKDLIKKLNRRFRESPDTKAVQDYAKQVGDSPEMVEKYLDARNKSFLRKELDIKNLSRESLQIGGEIIEVGHEVGLTTDIDRILKEEKKGRPVTSEQAVFPEPRSENRGKNKVGGSSKTINLDAAAGVVPRHYAEDYEMWKTGEAARESGEMDPFAKMGKEFHPDEQDKLRNLPENASQNKVNDTYTKIYENRSKQQQKHGIELHSKTGKKLDSKGLFRNIAKAAGQSNNPLANVSGDIVGAVMDGVAFIKNPNDKDALIDLSLSGSQAALSLAALGVAALPIPGARPGAFMLMKAGDNIAKVEKLWNLSSKINTTSKLGKTKNLIETDFNTRALTNQL